MTLEELIDYEDFDIFLKSCKNCDKADPKDHHCYMNVGRLDGDFHACKWHIFRKFCKSCSIQCDLMKEDGIACENFTRKPKVTKSCNSCRYRIEDTDNLRILCSIADVNDDFNTQYCDLKKWRLDPKLKE